MQLAEVQVTVNEDLARQLPALAAAMVHEAGAILYARARDRLDIDYPPSSKPGESPRRRSGDGRRSVFIADDDFNGSPVTQVGTADDRFAAQGRSYNYMAHWERSGRPWLLPALEAVQSSLEGALAAKFGAK